MGRVLRAREEYNPAGSGFRFRQAQELDAPGAQRKG